ncbi:hypothetical protein Tco_0522899 [Tanacetum coccineum]
MKLNSQLSHTVTLHLRNTLHANSNMALPPREQRHRFLKYEGLEYTDSDIADFESRENNLSDIGWRIDVPVERMVMEHHDEAGVVVFTSQAPENSISTTIEADSHSIRPIGLSQYTVSTRQNSTLLYKSIQTMIPFPSRLDNHYCKEEEGNYGTKFAEAYAASHINDTIPRKEKDLGRLGELAHTRLTVELADRTVKYPKRIAENVLVGIERMELDLEARLVGETLVLNRSLYHFLEDYIELNDLNKPFELRRNQGDDLMPTIEEGEVIEEFRTRDEDLDTGIDDYPSYCDSDKKIHIDCAHNLKFSCMIGFEFTHVNFFPLLYVNVMSKKFHNSIMKDKMVYKVDNVVGALMNVPIFVGTFYVVTDFAVLEDMHAYRDEGMGNVIIGQPFLREVGIKARRFDGMITIYNGNDEVTYQMVRSHPRFKRHTNKQCTNTTL